MPLDLHVYATADDIPPQLQKHLRVPSGAKFQTFHHPFLVDIFPMALPAPIETLLDIRQKYAQECLAQGSLGGYIFAHQRPYRMQTLIRHAMTGQVAAGSRAAIRFWQCAAQVWMDCEESETSSIWGFLLSLGIPHRGAMTSRKDRRAFRDLPDKITIYRGLQTPDAETARDAATVGYSWTLSSETAAFFSRRHIAHQDLPWIAQITVPKEMAIAYLAGRGEAEVVIDSDRLSPDEIIISPGPQQVQTKDEFVTLQEFMVKN